MDFKMKSLSYLRLAAVLVFAIPVSAAAQGPQPAYDPMYQKRFETMDKMIDDAQNRQRSSGNNLRTFADDA
jgi:hypothetical protein